MRVRERVVRYMHVRNETRDVGTSKLVVRVLMAGVCGTDVATVRGERPDVPDVLGHEMVGVVLAAPAPWRGRGFQEGTRVVLNPNRIVDDVHQRTGETSDGVWRDVVIFDDDHLRHQQLIPVPGSVLDAHATLLEPLACAVHALEAIGRQRLPGARALVVGDGNFAMLLSRLFLTEGAARVVVARPRDAHSTNDATRFPGCTLLDVARLTEDGNVDAFDVAVLALAGDMAAHVRPALDALAGDGVLHVWGRFGSDGEWLFDDGLRVDLQRLRQRNAADELLPPLRVLHGGKAVHLTGSRGARRADFDTAISWVEAHSDVLDGVIAEVVPVDRLPETLLDLAFDRTLSRRRGKVVVDFGNSGSEDPPPDEDRALGARYAELVRRCTSSASTEHERHMIQSASAVAWRAFAANDSALAHPADGKPFLHHVVRVVEYLHGVLGVRDPVSLSGAFVHDLGEWTDVGLDDIEASCGREVVAVVEDMGQDRSAVPASCPQDPSLLRILALVEDLDAEGFEARRSNILLKREHFRRLLWRPRSPRSQLLKLADNAVAYGSYEYSRAYKPRMPEELALFRAYMEQVPLIAQHRIVLRELGGHLEFHWSNSSATRLKATFEALARLTLRA